MSWHNANMCYDCFTKRYPTKIAYRLVQPKEDKCCGCGKLNKDGIYIKEDSKVIKCHHR